MVIELDGTQTRYPLLLRLNSPSAWDWDRDGVDEIVTRRDGKLQARRLNGTTAAVLDASYRGHALDWTGDGKLEYVAGTGDDGEYVILGERGAVIETLRGAEVAAVGDLDGDGRDEIISRPQKAADGTPAGFRIFGSGEAERRENWIGLPPEHVVDLAGDGRVFLVNSPSGFVDTSTNKWTSIEHLWGRDAGGVGSPMSSGVAVLGGQRCMAFDLDGNRLHAVNLEGESVHDETFGDKVVQVATAWADGEPHLVVLLRNRILVYP